MSQRLMRKGLAHKFAWAGDGGKFFEALDASGGWPVGYGYVGFEHTDERDAGFTNSPYNDGWWTVIASADDYYLWKLSPEALQRVVDAAVKAITIPRVNASKLWIESARGGKAAIRSGGAA